MTSQPTPTATAEKPPGSTDSHYCDCAIPLAVERAERHGAAHRACARCNRPISVRRGRW